MREIKFRAWDGQRMYYFGNHAYTLDYNDISGWNVYPNQPDYKGEWTTGEASFSANDFALMQVTGAVDKNKRDVYEGDIDEKYGVITWNAKRFRWDAVKGENENSLNDIVNGIHHKLNIIGNVFQNPELLSTTAPNSSAKSDNS